MSTSLWKESLFHTWGSVVFDFLMFLLLFTLHCLQRDGYLVFSFDFSNYLHFSISFMLIAKLYREHGVTTCSLSRPAQPRRVNTPHLSSAIAIITDTSMSLQVHASHWSLILFILQVLEEVLTCIYHHRVKQNKLIVWVLLNLPRTQIFSVACSLRAELPALWWLGPTWQCSSLPPTLPFLCHMSCSSPDT